MKEAESTLEERFSEKNVRLYSYADSGSAIRIVDTCCSPAQSITFSVNISSSDKNYCISTKPEFSFTYVRLRMFRILVQIFAILHSTIQCVQHHLKCAEVDKLRCGRNLSRGKFQNVKGEATR